MPRYEYRCESCGVVLEVQQKFSDAPLETHENCGGRLEKLISAPAFQFKGTGWYVTDYARGGSSKKPEGSKSDSSKSESKSDSDKSDSSKSDSGKSDSSKSDSSKSDSTKSESKPAADTSTKSASDK